eukprot:4888479-Pleurochrysis_carterae.AAC.2
MSALPPRLPRLRLGCRSRQPTAAVTMRTTHADDGSSGLPNLEVETMHLAVVSNVPYVPRIQEYMYGTNVLPERCDATRRRWCCCDSYRYILPSVIKHGSALAEGLP